MSRDGIRMAEMHNAFYYMYDVHKPFRAFDPTHAPFVQKFW